MNSRISERLEEPQSIDSYIDNILDLQGKFARIAANQRSAGEALQRAANALRTLGRAEA